MFSLANSMSNSNPFGGLSQSAHMNAQFGSMAWMMERGLQGLLGTTQPIVKCPHGSTCQLCAEHRLLQQKIEKAHNDQVIAQATDYKQRCADYMAKFRSRRHQ